MNYKIYLYSLFTLLSIYIISGINIEKIMKKNRIVETKLLVICLSCALSYLLTNFVVDFIGL